MAAERTIPRLHQRRTGDTVAAIDDSITDADSTTIESATITIGINRQPDDVLTIDGSLPAGITASSYDASTGVITLSGAASFADYQTALRQVVYSSPNPTPFTGDRVIDVIVNDGVLDSNSLRPTCTSPARRRTSRPCSISMPTARRSAARTI